MRWANIIQAQTDDEWFEEYVRVALNSPAPELPPLSQKIGNASAIWFETEPGVAFIRTTGGSIDDRLLAEIVVKQQLLGHNIRQAQYEVDWDHDDPQLIKEATWDDVESKAKRLIQSGNVQILRNGYNNVVGQVQGDHGSYQTEISREDPNSQAITQWQCECPWDQYAWQRTRQWKKYEGRLCSHALATVWASRSLPLDEDAHPSQQPSLFNMPQGTPGSKPSPFAAPVPPAQGQQLQIPGMFPGEATGTPAGPPQAMPQPTGPDILPTFPGDQEQAVNPASVPGLRQPSPTNPVQYPGGTFSSLQDDWDFGTISQMTLMSAQEEFVNGQIVSTRHEDWGVWQGRSEEHGAGDPAKVPAGSAGEVLGSDPTTGMVNVLFMNQATGVNRNKQMEPWGITAWFLPSEVVLRPDIRPPGPAIKRR